MYLLMYLYTAFFGVAVTELLSKPLFIKPVVLSLSFIMDTVLTTDGSFQGTPLCTRPPNRPTWAF